VGAVLPVDLQETPCRLPSMRCSVVVPDPGRSAFVVAAEGRPGREADLASCRAAVTAAHGGQVAAWLQLLPRPVAASPSRASPTGRPSARRPPSPGSQAPERPGQAGVLTA
jgi:hypothetical protein